MSRVLSKNEINDYIQTTVIPAFMPLLDGNVKSALWNSKGNLIIATHKLAQSIGFTDYRKILGLPIKKLLMMPSLNAVLRLLPRLKAASTSGTLSPERMLLGLDIMRKMHAIQGQVFTNKLPINAILIHPFENINKTALLLRYNPIFHTCGQVVAVQSFLSNFKMFGLLDYLSGYDNKTLSVPLSIINKRDLPLELTMRQYEILFLLTIGLTQKQVAEMLNINRGTVSRILGDVICPKFGMNDVNTIALVEKAKKRNIHKFIPPDLCKPWLIILNDDEDN